MIKYYVKKQRYLLAKGVLEDKYSIALEPIATLTEERMGKSIELSSTLAAAEFGLAMDMFSDEAMDAMAEGRSIQIGKLGWLCPKISASVADEEKDATAEKTLRNYSYYFRPSRALSRFLKQQQFKKKTYIPKSVKKEEKTEE